MSIIKPFNINTLDNVVPLDDSLRAVQNSSDIRDSELLILRDQVSYLELSLSNLTSEYKEFLEDNNLIDEDDITESVMPYPQVSPLYDPEEFSGANYVDRNSVLTKTPIFMPLSIAIGEASEILGQFGGKISWYQNEMKKKYALKKMLMKRIEDIESRENNR
jgi:hypothetical protein